MWFNLRILEQCNLRCKSCYAQNHDRNDIMTFNEFQNVLSIIETYKAKRDWKEFYVIYLSGGEPLMHPNFSEFLQYAYTLFDRITVLTNGLLVEKHLQSFIPFRDKVCVQVSLDGDQECNDLIRGRGTYILAVEALKLLEKYEIRHWLSYTVSQVNKHCYGDVLRVANQTNSLFNNITPYTGDPQYMLSYLEWKEFKYNYEKETKRLGLATAHGPNCCGFTYNCGEFNSGVAINPDGTIAGCARINNIRGNYTNLENLVHNERQLISQTCMKAKWGNIDNFELITSLE